MATVNDLPRKNSPPYRLMSAKEHWEAYWDEMLNKFIDEYLITSGMLAVQGNQDDIPPREPRFCEGILATLAEVLLLSCSHQSRCLEKGTGRESTKSTSNCYTTSRPILGTMHMVLKCSSILFKMIFCFQKKKLTSVLGQQLQTGLEAKKIIWIS